MVKPGLVQAAVEVLSALSLAGFRCCVIGGLAVQRWGEPRVTQDVDVSVLAPPGDESPPLDVLMATFAVRRPDARAFAMKHRVALLWATNRTALDVSLAASPFEIEALDRSTPWSLIPDTPIVTCSAEDLVIYKLVAGRPRDVADIDGVVRRQGARLDIDRIRRYAGLFAELKEDPELGKPFEVALAKAARASG